MQKKCSLMQRLRTLNGQYAQVLLVLAAFTLMVVSSYLYVSDLQRKNLRKNVIDTISHTQTIIKYDLLEPETLLSGVAETIRSWLMRGISSERIQEYISSLNNYVQINEGIRLSGVIGFYGIFDIYNGEFISRNGIWAPTPDFIPQNRPWYKAAVDANGDIGITRPYTDAVTEEMNITFSRRIFNDKNVPMGIVCLDMKLDRLRDHAISASLSEGGYGFLMTDDYIIIAHPNEDYVGKSLQDTNSAISELSDELNQKNEISERIILNYKNEVCIVYIWKLENGWYMGLVTPKDKYYQSTKNMGIILAILGATLAVMLSTVLFRIISQKQKADKKIHEAEDAKKTINTLKNIMNSLNAMIYVTVPHTGEILFINDYMKTHYNLDDDCVGRLCYKILQKGMNAKCVFCPCNHLDKHPEKIIEWIEHNSLTKRVYRNVDRYIEWPGGQLAHLQHSIDITELNSVKEQAIKANEAKSSFLARVSHEIRTPMNAILGITEIQLQNKALPGEIREALEKVYSSGYLLLNIINDILDLSKIEAGKLELIPVEYDISSIINDTVHLHIIRYDSKPIEFILQIDENIPAILFGDELRIKQIMNNLLSNAFKYTDSGKIILSISVENLLQEVKLKTQPIMLIFRISDTGQGMTKEQVNNLFQEYSRFNLEANRKTEGTGLGMNITQHLVRMMDGEIIVESNPGRGSVFTIKLPQGIIGNSILGSEMVEKLHQYHAGIGSHFDKPQQIVRDYMPYGRILVVDDVETNLYVAKGLMAPYGLSVETATSGREAIKKINEGSTYDIVFMDHFMPTMDGMEAVKIIRDLGYVRPIIALTANAVAGQADLFLANGFSGFISKPIDIRQLHAMLNKLVRDKYPTRVVEAARRLKNTLNKDSENIAAQMQINSHITEMFVKDAEKAVSILDAIIDNKYRRNDDFNMYVITVHAMKSALANIGEKELSNAALELEHAGQEKDVAAIEEKTPVFADKLRLIIEKLKPKEDDNELDIRDLSEGDLKYLHEKLAVMQEACTAYDKITAKNTLALLRHKKWPSNIKELLDIIAECLLHSEFEAAAKAVTDFKNI